MCSIKVPENSSATHCYKISDVGWKAGAGDSAKQTVDIMGEPGLPGTQRIGSVH